MAHRAIVPAGYAPPPAPYSPGVVAGNVVHVSGMLSLDAQGRLVGKGDVRAQTRQVLESIRAVIEAAGGTLADIAFNQVFLADLDDYAAMNEVYREYFPVNPPARFCIRADLVRPVFLVEIASTAYLPQSKRATRRVGSRPAAKKPAARRTAGATRARKGR